MTWIVTAAQWLFRWFTRDREADFEGRERDNKNWKQLYDMALARETEALKKLEVAQHAIDVTLPAKLEVIEVRLNQAQAMAFDLRAKLQDEREVSSARLIRIKELESRLAQNEEGVGP